MVAFLLLFSLAIKYVVSNGGTCPAGSYYSEALSSCQYCSAEIANCASCDPPPACPACLNNDKYKAQRFMYTLSGEKLCFYDIDSKIKFSEKATPINILKMAFSPYGNFIICGGPANQLLHTATHNLYFQVLITLTQGYAIKDFSISSDATTLVTLGTLSYNIQIFLIDLSLKTIKKTIITTYASQEDKLCTDFHPTGNEFASTGGDNFIRIWSSNDPFSTLRTYEMSSESKCVKYNSDATLLAGSSSGPDNKIYIWNLAAGTGPISSPTQTGSIWSLEWSPDNSKLLTASSDGVVKLWRSDDLTLLATLKNDIGDFTTKAEFLYDGSKVYAVGQLKKIYFWDSGGNPLPDSTITTDHSNPITDAEFFPLRKSLEYTVSCASCESTPTCTQCSPGWVKRSFIIPLVESSLMLRVRNEVGEILSEFETNDYHFFGSFNPDLNKFASNDIKGSIYLFDYNSRMLIWKIPAFYDGVDSLLLSPNGKWLASVGPGNIKIWDVEKASLIFFITYDIGNVVYPRIKFLNKGSGLIVFEKSAVKFYDLTTGKLIESQSVTDMEARGDLSPDESLVVIRNNMNKCSVVQTSDWTYKYTLTLTFELADVIFSPDGLMFATIEKWGKVIIWKTQDGSKVEELADNNQFYSSAPIEKRLRFSPDGSLLLCLNETLLAIWDISKKTVSTKIGVNILPWFLGMHRKSHCREIIAANCAVFGDIKLKCTKCNPDYYLLDKNLEGFFSECLHKYYLSGYYIRRHSLDGSGIVSSESACFKDCFDCLDSLSCLTCSSNYYLFDSLGKGVFSACISKDDVFDGVYVLKPDLDGRGVLKLCFPDCLKCSNGYSCTKCSQNYYLFDAHKQGLYSDCLSKDCLIEGVYVSSSKVDGTGTLDNCLSNCNICEDDHSCLKCSANHYLLFDKNREGIFSECVPSGCVFDYTVFKPGSDGSGIVGSCLLNCLECSDSEKCTKCEPNFYLLDSQRKGFFSQCVASASDGMFISKPDLDGTGVAALCFQDCLSCTDQIHCTRCSPNFYLFDIFREGLFSECLPKDCLLDGLYISKSRLDGTGELSYCFSNCAQCPSSRECLKCSPGHFLFDEKGENLFSVCLSNDCVFDGLYKLKADTDGTGVIKYCLPDCLSCADANHCTRCAPNFYLFDALKEGLFSDCLSKDCLIDNVYISSSKLDGTGELDYCLHDCATCVDGNTCLKCSQNYYLFDSNQQNSFSECLQKDCLFGGVFVQEPSLDGSGIVNHCLKGCSDCFDAAHCTRCFPNHYLLDIYREGRFSECLPSDCMIDGVFVSGANLDGTGQVDYCFSNCAVCDSPLACTRCFPGHYLFDKNKGNSFSDCLSKDCVLDGLYVHSPAVDGTGVVRSCFSNCVECTDDTHCSKCSPNNFLLDSYKEGQFSECLPNNCKIDGVFVSAPNLDGTGEFDYCFPKCAVCDSTLTCTRCFPGHYLFDKNKENSFSDCLPKDCVLDGLYVQSPAVDGTGVVRSCLSNCIECSDDTHCSKCSLNSFLLDSFKEGKFSECLPNNCMIDGVFVSAPNLDGTGQVDYCFPNCAVCDSTLACTRCFPGHYLFDKNKENSFSDSLSKDCVLDGLYVHSPAMDGTGVVRSCFSNCVDCTDDTHCSKCSPNNFLLDSYREGQFSECLPKDCLINGIFISLQKLDGAGELDFCLPKCDSCNDKNACLKCSPNYYLFDKNGQNYFSECLSEDCLLDGFFFLNSNRDGTGVVGLCLPGCAECLDDKSCTKCSPSYFLFDKKREGFYSECVSSSCLFDYTVIKSDLDGTGVILSCFQSCLECPDAYSCTKCAPNFYLFDKELKGSFSQCLNKIIDGTFVTKPDLDGTGVIAHCLANCLTCSNGKTCIKCFPNFYLLDKKRENSFSECVSKNGIVDGFYVKNPLLDGTGELDHCLDTCLACFNKKVCSKCKNKRVIPLWISAKDG